MFAKTLGKVVVGVRTLKQNTIGKIAEEADKLEAREKDFRAKLAGKVEPLANAELTKVVNQLGIDVNAEENKEAVEALREVYNATISEIELKKFQTAEELATIEKKGKEAVAEITKSFVGSNLANAQTEIQLEMLSYLRNQNNKEA